MIAALIARFGLHIAIAGGVLVALTTWDWSRVQKGRQIEKAAIERRGDLNAKKADDARRAAERLPADRLCDRYARDC